MFALLAATATAFAASSRPFLAHLAHLDASIQQFEHYTILDACLCVCREMSAGHAVSSNVPANAAEFVSVSSRLKDSRGLLEHTMSRSTHVVELLLGALADSDQESQLLTDAARAVAASARFTMLAPCDREAAEHALESAVASNEVVSARQSVLATARADRQQRAASEDDVFDARSPTHADDERIVSALYDVALHHLGPHLLAPLGFPSSPLGLLCLAASARSGGSQRAAASLGRICGSAAYETGPMFVVRGDAAGATWSMDAPATTLVVAFSSLGWHGLVRAEWLSTIRATAAAASARHHGVELLRFDVAHCVDSSRGWYATDPISGAYDGGRWWDANLAALCGRYQHVCLIGESMGGTAALRFARHATANSEVISLVPQIDLRDAYTLGGCNAYVLGAHTDEQKAEMLAEIVAACSESAAEVVVHFGRDHDDLRQIRHLPPLVAAYTAAGEAPTAPLPWGGEESRTMYSGDGLRCVKHDVEGHALASGLKEKGRQLHEALLPNLFAQDRVLGR